jgi:tRNA(Arg) A34 adenosine deaminase TadA
MSKEDVDLESSPSSKRLKVDRNEPIKWNPILSDDYTFDPMVNFEMVPCLIGEIVNNKKISDLIYILTEKFPMRDNKFKRVRYNKDKQVYEIIIKEKDNNNDNDHSNISSLIKNETEMILPFGKLFTRAQFDFVTSTYWPCSFHVNQYVESFLDGSFLKKNENYFINCDEMIRLTLKLAIESKTASAILLVDPRKWSIVASGVDSRQKHPLAHSTINALDNLSKRQQRELDNKKIGDMFEDPLETFFFKNNNSSKFKHSFDTHIDSNDYLCTNYIAFMTHEPCAMCAMALVHSRVMRIFYLLPTQWGNLKTERKLHCLTSLNHKYEVFQADFKQQQSIDDYFYNKKTKHPNIMN